MRAVTGNVERGFVRTAVGQGSVDPGKRSPHTQVLLPVLIGNGIHVLLLDVNSARWRKGFR